MRFEDSTVFTWVRAGTVRSIRVAGTVRVPAAELARIANSAAPEHPEEPT
jgi:hypothetical protein